MGCFSKKGLTVDYCSWEVTLSKSQNTNFPNLNNESRRRYNVIILIKTVFQPETKTRYEICSKLKIQIQEQRQCCQSGVFTVNFEHTSQLVLVFLLLTLNRQMKRQKQRHNGKMGRWLHSKFFLVIVPDYHIQGKRSNYICKLTVIFYLFHMHSVIRATLNSKTSSVFWFKNLSSWASLSRNKFLTIPADLVNEETINGEVTVRGGPMSGGYSTSIDAENGFILNSHILAKLRK